MEGQALDVPDSIISQRFVMERYSASTTHDIYVELLRAMNEKDTLHLLQLIPKRKGKRHFASTTSDIYAISK
jgi:ERCC4-type nuclease